MVETDYKFVVLVNKELENEIGRAMNAIAHCLAGLVNSVPEEIKEKMSFIDFIDKDGNSHNSISALSLIILRGKNNELKKAKVKFKELGIYYTDFIETMTGDTYKEQLEKTLQVSEDELKYFCVAAFGKKEDLDLITKRFSLWK